MSLVLQMRSERAELNNKLQALAKIEAGGGSLSAEQLAEFTSLESQIADLSAKLSRAEAAEKSAALAHFEHWLADAARAMRTAGD